jgi:hypothetical protein
VANNPTTWTDPSGQSAFAGTQELAGTAPITGKMVAEAAMLIAIRSASILTAAVCAVHSCTVGGVLLLFATGVLVCFLDTGSACWTDAASYATALYHYGSTAAAGAWSSGVSALREATVEYPALPHVAEPSTGPEPESREIPPVPPTNYGDNDQQCRMAADEAAAYVALFGINSGPTFGLEGHLRDEHSPNSPVSRKGKFNQSSWQNLRNIIRQALEKGDAHVNPSSEEDAPCEVTNEFNQPIGHDKYGQRSWTLGVYVDLDGHIRSAFPIPNTVSIFP